MCGTGIAAVCLLGIAAPAIAQDAPAAQTQAEPEAGDLIVVTGSRLARNGATAPTPVTVLSAEEVSLSGTVNIETLLNDTPQFLGSQNSGPTGNTVPGGTANLNMRGFGEQRNLVLVNGRRFAISGPSQTTDLNTIPAALIARTEIVTGGSSAVYGSDAITGVVNFIMRNDFEGVEARADVRIDRPSGTPTYNFDLTFGGNFADDRGNIVASVNYLKRGSITRGERGGAMATSLADSCVTAASYNPVGAGTPLAVPGGQTCRSAGGIPGLIFGGSGTIPNGRFSGLPLFNAAGNTPAYNAALAAAGLSAMTSRGFTFDAAGTAARPAVTPGDDYDLSPDAYLILPQERWMGNVFAHYDFNEAMTGYAEMHYSNNRVVSQIPPSGAGGNFLFDVNNPYLTPALREVLRQLDMRETGNANVTNGTLTLVNAPNDGRALVNVGRRLTDVGNRVASSDRSVFRVAVGLRGNIGSVSDSFLTDLSYDAYYTYARTSFTEIQNGSISLSRFQQGLLSQGGAAPALNIFGQNISPAAARAIGITSTSFTEASQEVLAANVVGQLAPLPYGPIAFNLGVEHRSAYSKFVPDGYLASGDVSGFNAAQPTAGGQKVTEFYGELQVPILKGIPAFERLTANGAARYSKYNLAGIGGVWTYSLGGEWAPTKDIAFRGQFQHAIRAPNVGELFGGRTTSGPSLVDPCSSRQPAAQQTAAVRAVCVATGVPAASVFTLNVQPNNFINQVLGGNPNVGAEVSDTKTFGVVFTPTFIPRLSITVDYFDIKLDGAIASLGGGAANVLNLCYNILQDANSEFCRAVNRETVTGAIAAPNYISTINANTGGIKTSGIDFELSYNAPLGTLFGEELRLDFATYQSWTREFTITPVQAFPNITNECVGAFGQTCGQPIPEWKGMTRVTLRNGPVALSLRHRYIGEVTVDTHVLPSRRAGATVPTLDSLTKPVIPTQNYFDLTAAFEASDKIQFTAGVRNLFNKYPPIVGTPSPAANTFAATYDVEGQVFFASTVIKF
ncbi:MAG: TonB-dependent receptor [Sphingomonadales bacterium]|nr:MAG: TonB-dependent receptor [Sphingomonadales bacterium]